MKVKKSLALAASMTLSFGLLGFGVPAFAMAMPSASVSSNPWWKPIKIFPQPPAGFDPLTASDQELAHYGFPQRPTNSVQLQAWTNALEHAKHWEAPNPVPGSTQIPPNTLGRVGGDGGNWAGFHANASDNGSVTYDQVSAKWTVPSVPGDSSYPNTDFTDAPAAAFWTGIGGGQSSSNAIIQAATLSIATSTAQYRFATEDYPQAVVYEGPVINPGDTVFVKVTYLAGNKTKYYLENETTGQYQTIENSTPYYDGSSADYEAEQLGPSLPDFYRTSFYDCMNEWNNLNNSSSLYADNYVQDTMVGFASGDILAQTTTNTVSSSNSGSFTVEWVTSY